VVDKGFFLWRIFVTWRQKKKGLANPTKGFFRIKKKIAISREKKGWKSPDLDSVFH
jgi:hypothetical protein